MSLEEKAARERRGVEQAQREGRLAKTWRDYLIELEDALDFWIKRAHRS